MNLDVSKQQRGNKDAHVTPEREQWAVVNGDVDETASIGAANASPILPHSVPASNTVVPPPKRRRVARPKSINVERQANTNSPIASATSIVAQMMEGLPQAQRNSTHSQKGGSKSNRNASSNNERSTAGAPENATGLGEDQPQKREGGLRSRRQQIEDAAGAVIADIEKGEQDGKKSRRKRNRKSTKDEDGEIAPNAVTMSDLARGSQVGKKSEMDVHIQEMNAAKDVEKKRKREGIKRRRQQGEQDPSVPPSEIAQTTNPGPQIQQLPEAEPEMQQHYGALVPETTIINGEIVLRTESTTINRQAEARAAAIEQEAVDETGKLERLTSSTHAKWAASRTKNWDEEDLEVFYKGLRTFGTDFQMISKMFLPDPYDPEGRGGRTRRQIKNRYTAEERRNPERIKEALLGPREVVDLAQLSSMTGTVYQDAAEVWQAVHDEAHDEVARREAAQPDLIGASGKRAPDEAQIDEAAVPQNAALIDNANPKENRHNAIALEIVAEAERGRKKGKKAAVPKRKASRAKKHAPSGEEVLGSIEDHRR